MSFCFYFRLFCSPFAFPRGLFGCLVSLWRLFASPRGLLVSLCSPIVFPCVFSVSIFGCFVSLCSLFPSPRGLLMSLCSFCVFFWLLSFSLKSFSISLWSLCVYFWWFCSLFPFSCSLFGCLVSPWSLFPSPRGLLVSLCSPFVSPCVLCLFLVVSCLCRLSASPRGLFASLFGGQVSPAGRRLLPLLQERIRRHTCGHLRGPDRPVPRPQHAQHWRRWKTNGFYGKFPGADPLWFSSDGRERTGNIPQILKWNICTYPTYAGLLLFPVGWRSPPPGASFSFWRGERDLAAHVRWRRLQPLRTWGRWRDDVKEKVGGGGGASGFLALFIYVSALTATEGGPMILWRILKETWLKRISGSRRTSCSVPRLGGGNVRVLRPRFTSTRRRFPSESFIGALLPARCSSSLHGARQTVRDAKRHKDVDAVLYN